MSESQLYPIIVRGAFQSFLLAFLYALLRWSLADSKSRGKPGWPLASLMVGAPLLVFAARMVFRASVPPSTVAYVGLGVPFLSWVVWLFLRPAVRQESTEAVLCGRDGPASRWLLTLSLAASGYGVAVAWLTQFVVYPSYLLVPSAAFPEYYAHSLRAIVFPVIVALSLSWTLSVILILYRPPAIPAWAPWSAVGLALLGFIASQALEVPYNQQLAEHGFNADAIHAKIANNWYRLIPWTLQSALLVWMTNQALSASARSARSR